MTGRFLFK